jgi:hypothetical protein
MITLAKVKMAGGEETPRFEAVLLWHGAPVALVSNDGNGGACRVYWRGKAGGAQTPDATIDAVYDAAVAQQEPGSFAAKSRTLALDFVILEEVEIFQIAKKLDRACAKSILFRTPGQGQGEYFVARGTPSPEVLAAIVKRHPAATILNALPSRERAELILR